MSIVISLLVMILVVALVVYLVGLIPIDPKLKQAVYVVLAVILLIWLLSMVGGWHFPRWR